MLDACNNKRASCVPQIPIIKSICVMAFLGPMSFGVCLLFFDPYSQWYDSACAPCTFHSNKITSTKWNSHQVHLLSTQLLQLLGNSYPHRLMAYFLPLLFIFFVYLSPMTTCTGSPNAFARGCNGLEQNSTRKNTKELSQLTLTCLSININ